MTGARALTAEGAEAREGPGLRISLLEDHREVSALVPDWTALAKAVRPASVFHHPAVWHSWVETLAQGQRNPVLALHAGSRLAGVLPLMVRRAWRGPALGVRYDYDPADRRWLTSASARPVPVRQLSPALSLPATMLGPMLLSAPGLRVEAIRAAARAMARLAGWDALVLPIEADEAPLWHEALSVAGLAPVLQPLDRPACQLAAVAPADEVVARQRKKFRQNTRRAQAAAQREGLAVALLEDPAVAMPVIRHLAGQSWKVEGRKGEHVLVPYAGPQEAFFEALLLRPDAPASVTAVASQRGEPVAAMIATIQAGTMTTLLTFWNGEAKVASPGLLVISALLDLAAARGVSLVDYNSNNPWVRHLCDRVTVQHNMLAFARTPQGQVLRAIRRGAVALRDLRRARPDPDRPSGEAT